MRRRDFIAGLGAAALPRVALAQQRAQPVVGFLGTASIEAWGAIFASFRRGLAETGYIEGQNVAIDQAWALNNVDRLPELAADLVRRRVTVIVSPGSMPASLAAKAATTTIPIVFETAADPVQFGLVTSLNRPGGNITGFTEINTEIESKRLGLLHEMIPSAVRFGSLAYPKNVISAVVIQEAQAAADRIGRSLEKVTAVSDAEIESAFANFVKGGVGALVIAPDGSYYARRAFIAALATRYALPVIYWDRAFPDAGGLMSYGASISELFRQVGVYTGRILRGEKPADLPVQRPTKFELVINIKTAKAMGIEVPESLLSTADEVID
jgi:putative tryptophan/tyrosine transport system substrate-binding protein